MTRCARIVVEKAAAGGNCVIVGRGGQCLLSGRDDTSTYLSGLLAMRVSLVSVRDCRMSRNPSG